MMPLLEHGRIGSRLASPVPCCEAVMGQRRLQECLDRPQTVRPCFLRAMELTEKDSLHSFQASEHWTRPVDQSLATAANVSACHRELAK